MEYIDLLLLRLKKRYDEWKEMPLHRRVIIVFCLIIIAMGIIGVIIAVLPELITFTCFIILGWLIYKDYQNQMEIRFRQQRLFEEQYHLNVYKNVADVFYRSLKEFEHTLAIKLPNVSSLYANNKFIPTSNGYLYLLRFTAQRSGEPLVSINEMISAIQERLNQNDTHLNLLEINNCKNSHMDFIVLINETNKSDEIRANYEAKNFNKATEIISPDICDKDF